MKLLEAIVDANHRALAGDAKAGLQPDDYANELPLAALTCIDSRLNPLFPEVLGLPKEKFIWLRNAGNIVTGPTSSTMRSLALACAVKGGREIAIIGHSDCLVCKTSAMGLMDAFKALGVERGNLPENLTEFFGLFASERQNVIKGVEYVRHSPLIGPKIPVHGLMVDVSTGKLEWVVNGYQALEMAASERTMPARMQHDMLDGMKSFAAFQPGEMKFPETKIGEAVKVVAAQTVPEQQPIGSKATSVPVPPPLPMAGRRAQLPPIKPGFAARDLRKR